MFIKPYSLQRISYLSDSEGQSMYICEIPFTVSSCTFNFIMFALGAKAVAYFITLSGKVAEKRRIWMLLGSMLQEIVSVILVG